MAKVLLVDDDQNIHRALRGCFAAAGHEFLSASDGETGLAIFRSGRPDVVLLDIGLPDASGFDLCRDILSESKGDIPVLFLTAKGDTNSRLSGFQAGAEDYIPKPVVPEEVLARVRVHLGLRTSRQELAKRNYELELRERLRNDLNDMIVHDLKSPVAAIQTTLSLVRENGLITDMDYQRLLDNSEKAAGKLLLMINDLLDVSRAEAGGLTPQTERVEVDKLLSGVVELYQTSASRTGLSIRTSVGPDARSLTTDAQLLYRILANLLSNALRFSPRGTEVLLEVSLSGRKMLFSVSDSGPGVPQKDKARIFEKFVQIKPGKGPRERGSGIGLAFCRLAAQALGGRIWYEDREGGGSRFILELPA
ncbi:MAG: ATP-binding protein [Elusimicrobiota bacterium]